MRAKPAMIDNIRLRMAHDEKRRLAEIASRRGVTISELIRQHVSALIEREAA